MADEVQNENLVGTDNGADLEELPKELIDKVNEVEEQATQVALDEGEIVVDGGSSGPGRGAKDKKVTDTKKYGDWPIEKNKVKISQIYNPKKNHYGVDFTTNRKTGVQVKAYRAGVVVAMIPEKDAKPDSGYDGYGNTIVISHGAKKFSLYAHLASFDKSIAVNKKVRRGHVIGTAGNTGKSDGIHLHFEVRNAPKYPATKRKPDLEGIEKVTA